MNQPPWIEEDKFNIANFQNRLAIFYEIQKSKVAGCILTWLFLRYNQKKNLSPTIEFNYK